MSNSIRKHKGKPIGLAWFAVRDFHPLPWRGFGRGDLHLCYDSAGNLVMYRPYGYRGFHYHHRSGHLARFSTATKLLEESA